MKRFSYGKTFLVGFGFFGISIIWPLFNSLIPPMLEDLGLSALVVGFIMTWDNIIGFTPQTPYDTAGRGLNFRRTGNPGEIDNLPGQVGRFTPLPEMAQYRMPIKNLYATGTWRSPGGASSHQGYGCYKVIAEDQGLRKPWEEKGRPY